MKKIINNKLYDTETAKSIGFSTANCSCSDFNYWEEELYRKKTGEYFLYGKGGPMTKYSVSHGDNSWSGGSKIIPLSFEKAREWAEENLEADDYIECFGEPTGDDDTRQTVTITVPSDVVARLRREAEQHGKKLSDVFVEHLTI